jgi:hypothetical protein
MRAFINFMYEPTEYLAMGYRSFNKHFNAQRKSQLSAGYQIPETSLAINALA